MTTRADLDDTRATVVRIGNSRNEAHLFETVDNLAHGRGRDALELSEDAESHQFGLLDARERRCLGGRDVLIGVDAKSPVDAQNRDPQGRRRGEVGGDKLGTRGLGLSHFPIILS